MPNRTGLEPDRCGKICSIHAATAPEGVTQGDARMGGEQATTESSNACAPAVGQQDVSDGERWVPLPWIVLGLVFCVGVDFGVFLGLWQALRRLAC